MPRIQAETLPEHRLLVFERVFGAFSALMGEQSYDAITMAQLAQRAGLGRTAIYHHFHDKEAVVVAFAGHETARYVARLSERLAVADTPSEQLRIYVRSHLDSGEEFHMGLGPQLYGVLPASSLGEIREHVAAVEQVLAEILVAGRDSGEFVVDDLEATMRLVHACLSPRHVPPETIEAFVLRAVGAAGSE
ncbi:MAG: TetR/AcrR family transcriptional regulator [Nocardioides sp.]|uniref:TetR/AcrR family transcriptional regulator n=1 Tax=Nocardioides sp. TaxID=35761 RepID=UPI0039E4ADC5